MSGCKPKCCGTCKHWGRTGQKEEWRECQDAPKNSVTTTFRHGILCPDWEAKRPARKPAPSRRWSRNGSMLLFDGAVELLAFYEDISGHVDPDAVVRALNKHRVVLPKGIRK